MTGVLDIDAHDFRYDVVDLLEDNGYHDVAESVRNYPEEWVEILWEVTDGYVEDAANKAVEIDDDAEWFMAHGAEG